MNHYLASSVNDAVIELVEVDHENPIIEHTVFRMISLKGMKKNVKRGGLYIG